MTPHIYKHLAAPKSSASSKKSSASIAQGVRQLILVSLALSGLTATTKPGAGSGLCMATATEEGPLLGQITNDHVGWFDKEEKEMILRMGVVETGPQFGAAYIQHRGETVITWDKLTTVFERVRVGDIDIIPYDGDLLVAGPKGVRPIWENPNCTLTKKVDSIETQLTEVAGNLFATESSVTSLAENLSNLASDVAALPQTAVVTSIQTSISTLNGQVSQLQTDLNTLTDVTIADLIATSTTNSQNIGTALSQLESVNTAIDGITTQLSQITTSHQELSGQVTAILTRLDTAESTLSGHHTRIEDLETHLSEIDDLMLDIDLDIREIRQNISEVGTIQSELTALRTDIQQLQASNIATSSALTLLNDTQSSHGSQIGTVTSQAQTNSDDITTLTTTLDTALESINQILDSISALQANDSDTSTALTLFGDIQSAQSLQLDTLDSRTSIIAQNLTDTKGLLLGTQESITQILASISDLQANDSDTSSALTLFGQTQSTHSLRLDTLDVRTGFNAQNITDTRTLLIEARESITQILTCISDLQASNTTTSNALVLLGDIQSDHANQLETLNSLAQTNNANISTLTQSLNMAHELITGLLGNLTTLRSDHDELSGRLDTSITDQSGIDSTQDTRLDDAETRLDSAEARLDDTQNATSTLFNLTSTLSDAVFSLWDSISNVWTAVDSTRSDLVGIDERLNLTIRTQNDTDTVQSQHLTDIDGRIDDTIASQSTTDTTQNDRLNTIETQLDGQVVIQDGDLYFRNASGAYPMSLVGSSPGATVTSTKNETFFWKDGSPWFRNASGEFEWTPTTHTHAAYTALNATDWSEKTPPTAPETSSQALDQLACRTQVIESMVSRGMPVGMMAQISHNNVPLGWLIADGSSKSRSEYSQLFEIIGNYEDSSGAHGSKKIAETVSISGSTVTVTFTAHGLSNDDWVAVRFNHNSQLIHRGVKIKNVTPNTFEFETVNHAGIWVDNNQNPLVPPAGSNTLDFFGGTQFKLPDFRGTFLRGVDGGSGVDPDAGTRTAANGGALGISDAGTSQGFEIQSHHHSMGSSGGGSGLNSWDDTSSISKPAGPWLTSSTGGSETRPKNKAVHFILYYGQKTVRVCDTV